MLPVTPDRRWDYGLLDAPELGRSKARSASVRRHQGRALPVQAVFEAGAVRPGALRQVADDLRDLAVLQLHEERRRSARDRAGEVGLDVGREVVEELLRERVGDRVEAQEFRPLIAIGAFGKDPENRPSSAAEVVAKLDV